MLGKSVLSILLSIGMAVSPMSGTIVNVGQSTGGAGRIVLVSEEEGETAETDEASYTEESEPVKETENAGGEEATPAEETEPAGGEEIPSADAEQPEEENQIPSAEETNPAEGEGTDSAEDDKDVVVDGSVFPDEGVPSDDAEKNAGSDAVEPSNEADAAAEPSNEADAAAEPSNEADAAAEPSDEADTAAEPENSAIDSGAGNNGKNAAENAVALYAGENAVTYTEDFEGEIAENWGMSQTAVDATVTRGGLSLVQSTASADYPNLQSASGSYLRLKGTKQCLKSAVKDLNDFVEGDGKLPGMTEAIVSFKWYLNNISIQSNNGAVGLRLRSMGNEVLGIYVGNWKSGASPKLYYSTNGIPANTVKASELTDSGKTLAFDSDGACYQVSISFDFTAHTAAISVDEETVASAISIGDAAGIVDQMELVCAGTVNSNTFTVDMGIDDFTLSYIPVEVKPEDIKIASIQPIPEVSVTEPTEAEALSHPVTAKAILTDSNVVDVEIDADTWTCTPEFDKARRGYYTWTADIKASAEYNPKKQQVSYIMAYRIPLESEHDYENEFTFPEDTDGFVVWGRKMQLSEGKNNYGDYGFTLKVSEGDDKYLSATVTSKPRGSRLDLNSETVKASEVTFDWMPVKGEGRVMFLAPDFQGNSYWHPYFTLQYGTDGTITYFTENTLPACSTEQKEFDGRIPAENAVNTGMGGLNRWYTVNVKFDYAQHTAQLVITDRADTTKSYTSPVIPIEPEAYGLKSFVLQNNKSASELSIDKIEMGIDNLIVDYEKLGANDIADVEALADVKVAREAFNAFAFPKEVTVTMGDGSRKKVAVGDWTATPGFDKEKENDYVWEAPLTTTLNNLFGLKPGFRMHYTLLPVPLYLHNPATLELEYGKEWDGRLPEKVTAFMSDGSTNHDVYVGEWTPIREFNAEEEGIYVYGANIKEDSGAEPAYQIERELLVTNENHEDEGSDRALYQYDVYYRISYFATEDNYNAYTRSMEYLDRGVYAIPAESGGIFVSWRLLVTEYGNDKNIGFNIYRNGVLVNSTPVTSKTNYLDTGGKAGDTYTVVKLQDGQRYESDAVTAIDKNYLSIPVQKPEPQKRVHVGTDPGRESEYGTYTLNDAGVADVDGDGEYEIIVKWYPSNGFDSGNAKNANGSSSPTIFDIYEMDGTPLWRLNLGLEMPSGAHYNQFMLYDLDEDGKAELFIKTSDGSVSYKPNADGKFDMTDESTIVSYIGDKSVVPGTNIHQNGHVDPASNEYVTVFNGQTGEEISTVKYANPTEYYELWGTRDDGSGGENRSARYNIALAYLPKAEGSTETIPAVLINRGYYKRTTVAAYTLRDGELKLEWNFQAANDTVNAGKGNHNMSTGDIDNDGFDEVVIGALAIDHNGEALWVKDGEEGRDFSGHADAIHLTAPFPDSDQLYVMVPSEEKQATLNCSVTNAATGARVAGSFLQKGDVGRGMMANITPNAGYEFWAQAPNSEIPDEIPSGTIYNVYGDVIATEKPRNFSCNWRIYWDGDLLSELADGSNPSGKNHSASIFKYDWDNNKMNTVINFAGTMTNNSTKNTPSLAADLFGDWREEIMLRSADDTELRIYMTNIETDYKIYTLMHDPVYRNAVANQNTAYNQPPHVSFYLGEDAEGKSRVQSGNLPTYPVRYTTTPEETGAVDKSELRAEVEKSETFEEGNYTAESWSAYVEALEAARTELVAEDSTKESVEAALKALKEAQEALELKKSSLVMDDSGDERAFYDYKVSDDFMEKAGEKGFHEVKLEVTMCQVPELSEDVRKGRVLGNQTAFEIELKAKTREEEAWKIYKGELWSPVTIIRDMPDTIELDKDIVMFHIHTNEDGTKEISEITPEIKEGKIFFEVSRFSTFLIANAESGVDITPEPGTSTEPGSSPEPGTSTEPGSSPEPGTSTEPGSSPEPGTSTEPGSSPEPGTTIEPVVTPTPSNPPSGDSTTGSGNSDGAAGNEGNNSGNTGNGGNNRDTQAGTESGRKSPQTYDDSVLKTVCETVSHSDYRIVIEVMAVMAIAIAVIIYRKRKSDDRKDK